LNWISVSFFASYITLKKPKLIKSMVEVTISGKRFSMELHGDIVSTVVDVTPVKRLSLKQERNTTKTNGM